MATNYGQSEQHLDGLGLLIIGSLVDSLGESVDSWKAELLGTSELRNVDLLPINIKIDESHRLFPTGTIKEIPVPSSRILAISASK